MSQEDEFTVAGDGRPLPPGTAFTSYRIWTIGVDGDGEIVGTKNWTTPALQKPLVAFSAVSLGSGNATTSVAGASQAVSASNYRVNLQVGTSTGTAVAMPTTGGSYVTLVVNAMAYRVYWTDIGAERTLNSGDIFRVTGNGVALPPASSFAFHLLWSDGSAIQQVFWTTP